MSIVHVTIMAHQVQSELVRLDEIHDRHVKKYSYCIAMILHSLGQIHWIGSWTSESTTCPTT